MAFLKCKSSGSYKSAIHNPQSTIRNPQSTRAVVVGISDYQDKGIPDLQYAHRDAEVFTNWLHSSAGGSVPADNIRLLLNEKATIAQFGAAIDWLLEETKEGDRVVIYFSGHGDMEAKILNQLGFLLLWDSPAHAYIAGALPVDVLKNVVTTLSVEQKANVLVIADACRAGKLAGSNVIGAQLTNANLGKQFANEQKILSCQADEYSIEGKQWGSGRGVFSWHLVNGLYGLADLTGDKHITLLEIERFLQDRVMPDVAPLSQIPLTGGDKNEVIAQVDEGLLASVQQGKDIPIVRFSSVEQRGLVEDVLAKADTSIVEIFHAFQQALKAQRFLEPAGNCAEDYYNRLMREDRIKPLHNYLRRNYAAALQDEAQQALNAMLNDDPYEQNQWDWNPDKYTRYPEYLEKAIELLGEQHYMYNILMAKQLFFKARIFGGEEFYWANNDSIKLHARQLLSEALKYQPNAAYLYYGIGYLHWDDADRDSFFLNHNKAISLAPTWIMPRLNIIDQYLLSYNNPDWETCERYILDALALKPDSYILTEQLACVYQRMFRMEDAIALAHKMTEMRPELSNGYAILGTTYKVLRQYDLSEHFAGKALQVDSSVLVWPMNELEIVYCRTRQYDKEFKIYEQNVFKAQFRIPRSVRQLKMVEIWEPGVLKFWAKYPCSEDDLHCKMGRLAVTGTQRLWQGRFQEAKSMYLQALSLWPHPDKIYIEVFNGLAQIAYQEGKPDSAEYYFQEAIDYQFNRFGSWMDRTYYAEARYHYARFLLTQNRLDDAQVQLEKAEQIDPRNPLNYYGMAALHATQKHDKEALDWLAKALEWYYPDYDEIMAEPLFKKIRETKRFKALMKQYFPDGSDRPKVEALARKYMPELFGK